MFDFFSTNSLQINNRQGGFPEKWCFEQPLQPLLHVYTPALIGSDGRREIPVKDPTMRKLWFRPRSRIVTLVYFNDAHSRTKEHVDSLIAYFLRRHWTLRARALECDVLRALAASFSLKPDLISRQAEIDRKAAAWLLSRDEDRRQAAERYRAGKLPRLDP